MGERVKRDTERWKEIDMHIDRERERERGESEKKRQKQNQRNTRVKALG